MIAIDALIFMSALSGYYLIGHELSKPVLSKKKFIFILALTTLASIYTLIKLLM